MITEQQKTEAVGKCESFADLEKVIQEYSPFISTSREEPVEWSYQDLMRRICMVLDGGSDTYVTRANGLREKVQQLVKRR